MKLEEALEQAIKEVPDFPQPGISFKDITPLLLDQKLVHEVLLALLEPVEKLNPTHIAAIESRGFLFGFMMAKELGLPFIPVRKSGKLPRQKLTESYSLEYGTATVEVHREDIPSGARVVIHDDLLATGGTAIAACNLIQQAGAQGLAFSFLLELSFLQGREKLLKHGKVFSLLKYHN